MPLNEFQKQFKDLMLDHPKALDTPPPELVALCASGHISLPTRLKVYRNNIIGGLTDVMVASFPLLETLVGKEFLEGMARSFILKHPPDQGCITFYGAGFAEFIEGFEPAKSLAYLPDVARFEIAQNDAYYAKDDEALDAETLSALPPEALSDIVLRPRDSVKLMSSHYPLLAIHDFCQNAKETNETLNLDQGGGFFMIYRPALQTQIIQLQPDEYCMLQHLADEKTLGESLSNTLEAFPAFNIQEFLQKHLVLETFMAMPANTPAR